MCGPIILERSSKMSIVIVGAGSVGLLLGSYLAESGIDVTMFVRREEQEKIIGRKGIRRLNEDGTESVFYVDVTSDIRELTGSQLLIIAVKYADLHGILEKLIQESIKSPLLFIQNGIGHLAVVKETDFMHIAFATVEHGALKIDDRTVRHNGVGALTIGEGFGDAKKFDLIEKANSKSFPVVRHVDAEHILMRKVMINCMINPLTAILDVKNGELLTNDSCYTLFKSLHGELMVAFPEMVPVLSLESVEAVCRRTANNTSSMLSDRLAGRPMEIETIVTAIIRKAQAVNKKVPLLMTCEKMLYAINEKGEVR